MDFFKGKIFSVIEDNRALVHVFIVVFYFEDFMICSQNTSLLRMAISFDSIPLFPFILFFAIIAVSKVVWHIIHYAIHAYRKFVDKPIGDQSIRDSFTAFLLFLVSVVYAFHFTFNDSIRPVSRSEHPMLFFYIGLALAITVIFSFYLGVIRGTDFSDGDQKK